MYSRRDRDVECTRELVEEVARQLATRTMRDSDLGEASELDGTEEVAILQGGYNKRTSMDSIADFFDDKFGYKGDIDAIKEKLDKLSILYGDTAYWNSHSSYIPKQGEIIIYSDKSSKEVDGETVYIPGIKVGSGNAYVSDLAFVGDDVADFLLAHINDNVRHITAAERSSWNNKLNVDDNFEVVDGVLIFNRN